MRDGIDSVGSKEREQTMTKRRTTMLAALACLALAGTARAQGDGPHNLPLVPKDMNLFVAMPMGLSGNFNPSQTVLIPGANVDVFAVPVTYIRTFSLGGRFGRLFLTAPLATLDASGTSSIPAPATRSSVSRGRSGWMDPMVTMHVGLVGAPALAPAEFVKHPRSFQMVAIVGTAIPIGTYDSDAGDQPRHQPVDVPAGPRHGGAARQDDGLGVGEHRHAVHREHRRVRGGRHAVAGPAVRQREPRDPRLQPASGGAPSTCAGSTAARRTTDGFADDNRTNILGGGLTLGHTFTPHFNGYVSYGNILASSGNADEWLVRAQIVYSF